MQDDLTRLTEVVQERKATKGQYQIVHKKWSTWNHWASNQDGYIEWAYENAFKQSDLKAKRDFGIDVPKDWDEGKALWMLRHMLYERNAQLTLEESNLLRFMWKTLDEDGKYRYTLEQIAEAYGTSQNYMFKHLHQFSWYKPRNDMPGSKRHKPHLKIVKDAAAG